MSLKKQITLNLVSNYAMTGVAMVLGFIVVPFLIHKLGKDSFGIVALVESLVLLFEVVTVSVRQALSRYATFALSQGRKKDFEDYLSTGRIILYGSAALVLAVGIVVSFYFPALFRVPAGQEDHASRLFLLITIGFAASIPNSIYWAVLYARQRFDMINMATSIGLIARAVLILAWFSLAPASWATMTAYGVICCGVILADNATVYFFHKKVYPNLRLSLKNFRPDYVREIISYSVHTSISRLNSILVSNTIQVCMNVFWGPATNAIYSIAQKIPGILRKIFVEPVWTLTSTFTKLVAEGDRKRTEQLFLSVSKALTIVIVPLCLGLVAFGTPLIRFWIGPGFDESADLMVLYVLPAMLGIPASVCGCLNSAYGKVKVPSLVGLIVSIASALAGIVLATVGGMRLFGFAYANLATGILYVACFNVWYACHISKISVRKYLVHSLLRPYALALPLAGAYFFFGAYSLSSGRGALMVYVGAGIVVTVVYAAGCLLYVLDDEERRFVYGAFSGLRSLLPGKADKGNHAA